MHDDAIARFEAGMVPDAGFHHRDHVEIAWHYVRRYPLPEALARFAAALKRFALARGKPDLYHETITTAFVLLINERVNRAAPEDWPAFSSRHAELLDWKPSILDRYYTAETLGSARARTTFLMPDKLARD